MTETHTAFELAEELAGTVQPVDDDKQPVGDPIPVFQGATIPGPLGETYDIAAKLDEGDGHIVVSTANTELVELLRGCPALVEVPVPADWNGVDELDDMTKAMLQDEAERLGLSRGGTKPELVERIKAKRAELVGAPLVDPPIVEGAPGTDTQEV